MKIQTRKVFTVLFWLICTLSSARTYYVAPTGKDSNQGTISEPWQTWAKAFSTAMPGDTVYFRGGVYPTTAITGQGIRYNPTAGIGHDGTASEPIVYSNYPGEKPILDCSNISSTDFFYTRGIWLENLDYVTFKGLHIRNVNQIDMADGGSYDVVIGWECETGNNVTFDQCVAYNMGGIGFRARYADTVSYVNCDAFNCADTLHMSLPGSYGTGFSTGGDDITGIVTYTGCRAWQCGDQGFSSPWGATSTYDNCWSFNNGMLHGSGNGFKSSSSSVTNIANLQYQKRVFRNCLAFYNGNPSPDHSGTGFTTNDQNALGSNCTFYNCTSFVTDGYGFVSYTSTTSPTKIYVNNVSYGGGYGNTLLQSGLTTNTSNSWNGGVTVTIDDFLSVDSTGVTGPRQADGSLPDLDFLKLAPTSGLIDAGVDVGLPFSGSAPDLGWSEYAAASATPTAPVYLNSFIENTTPARLEMTYNLTLANIVPAASTFAVRVNSSARTVNSVAISGTRVLLTLSSSVVYGDVVTVAYTKPSTNPLQTTAGGQAASITAQNVTNYIGAVSPVYVSSVIENTTPSRLEMTYNLTLANIVPAASTFAVRVNSSARTVNSVAISGTKVLLTLSSPVVYGDVVTVAYTKPSTNPLQTTAGGQAAAITAQNVTNNIGAVSPVYISSVIENATPSRLEMTYNLTLANIIPAASTFAVRVNSSVRTVNSVAISGTKVLLTLSSPVVYGDVVTVAYTKPATNPLQTSAGGQVASITSQNVTNNVGAVSPAYISSAIENATPSRLEMTYNLALANIVPAVSSFFVRVNSSARTVSSVAISGNKVLLTLSSPVVYGDVVTVAYTKPATNPMQTSAGGQVASITAQNVTNNIAAVNHPPIVNISSPTKSTSFISPATITIDAIASDPDGVISKVEFYRGNVKLGETTSAPYSFTWKEVNEGIYVVTAAATDNQGLRTISTSVSVFVEKSATAVNQLPEVNIITPISGKKVKKNTKIAIEAVASDSDGTISKVEFKNGSIILAEVTSAPYIFTWEAVDTGNFVISVIATDNLGSTSTACNLEIRVGLFYDVNSEVIKLYPNPNDGHFKVNLISDIPGRKNRVTIINLSGQTVFEGNLTKEEDTKEIDISSLTPGTYILMVTNEQNIITTKKFIKN